MTIQQLSNSTSGTIIANNTYQNLEIIHDAITVVPVLNIVFPSTTFNGQTILIHSKLGINNLTLSSSSGTILNTITVLRPSSTIKYEYISSTNNWYLLSNSDYPLLTAYSSTSGTVTSTDTTFTAIQKLDGNLLNIAPLNTVGRVLTENWNNLSNWTQSVGTWTVGSNMLNLPSTGVDTFLTARLTNTSYGGTKCRLMGFSFSYVIPTIGSSTYGISFGWRTKGNSERSLAFKFCSDSTDKGHIKVYYGQSMVSIIKQTPNPLPIASGDTTNITVDRIKNTFIITWKNGINKITFRYEAPNNAGSAGSPPNYSDIVFYSHNNATSQIGQFLWDINEVKGGIAVVGDSIAVSTTAENINQCTAKLISDITGDNIVVLAGNSDRIEDNNANEVLLMQPKHIIIHCTTNNIASGDSTATMLSKLSSFVGSLTGYTYNTNLWIVNNMPRNDFDMSAANTALSGAYAGVWDVYTTFKDPATTGISSSASADGIHLVPEEMHTMANMWIKYGTFFNKKNNPHTYNRTPFFQGDNLGVGNTIGIPKYALDIQDTRTSAQLRLRGGTPVDGGLYIYHGGGSVSRITSGIAYENGTYMTKSTTYSGFELSNGQTIFINRTAATVGNTLSLSSSSPSWSGDINPSGKWTFYSRGSGIEITESTTTATRGLLLSEYPGLNTTGALLRFAKTRANSATNTAVASGDDIGIITYEGADGTSRITSAIHKVVVSGTVSTGVVPMDFIWYAGTTNSPSETFRVNINGISTSLGFSAGYVSKTATYTILNSDYTIDCTSNTFTVTLPTAVGITGKIFNIKNSGTGIITINTTSSQTIDGNLTKTLTLQYSGCKLQSNGTSWIIIGTI